MSIGDLIRPNFPGAQYDPREHAFTIQVNGRVVSHVGMDDRTIKVGEQFVRVAAIGFVVTHESVRHRKFATTLMQLAHDAAKESGIPFAALFTGVPQLYVSRGYEFKENLSAAEPGGMVASLDGSVWPEGVVDLRGKAW